MIENALRLLRDGTSLGDLKLLNAALRELRYAFKVFAPYRGVRKVTAFGSARTPPGTPAYRTAHEFARRDRRAAASWSSPAAVAASCAPARRAPVASAASASTSDCRSSRTPNEFIHGDPKLVNFRYFFTRKLIFMKEADADRPASRAASARTTRATSR